MTGASLANGVYSETLSYDAMARPTETSLTRTSDSALMFDSKRAYDPVGNVANVWTTLPSGTDYQAFCYDEQNRLWWASSQSGGVPCGGSWTAGSLTSAQYTNTYTYDTLNRLTAGPLGTYTYSSGQPLDAATAIGSTYTAAYDAAGNMTCHAPTSSTICTGSMPTGALLTYDNEWRLSAWQSRSIGGASTSTQDLYDGEGNRVEQQVTVKSEACCHTDITTATYVATIEELSSTDGGNPTTTTYYYAAGQRIAQAVNGVFSYLGSDGLGSAEVALDGSGNVQASVLYGPFGNGRYSSGSMPGSYGYTGQRADAATGLDYYNARYYDPVAGQFTSADSVQDGLNRYAYVAGNPESRTDPTGHRYDCGDSCDDANSDPTVTYTENYYSTVARQHVTVGAGKQVDAGNTATGGQSVAAKYAWCTRSGLCAYAYGYYGSALKKLTQFWQAKLQHYQNVLDLLDGWAPTLGSIGTAATWLITAFIYGVLAEDPDWENAANRAGLAGGIALPILLDIAIHFVQGVVDSLKQRVSRLQAAYKANESVWYLDPQPGVHGVTGQGLTDDFIVESGTSPGTDVRHQIGITLWQECYYGNVVQC